MSRNGVLQEFLHKQDSEVAGIHRLLKGRERPAVLEIVPVGALQRGPPSEIGGERSVVVKVKNPAHEAHPPVSSKHA